MKKFTRKKIMMGLTFLCACLMVLCDKQSVKAACSHPVSRVEITSYATCTEAMQKRTFCGVCRTTLGTYSDGSALGHNYQWKVTETPTCHSGGKEEYTCTRCDHVRDGHTLNATGNHSWVETGSANPSCTSEGYKSYKCGTSGCSATKKEKNGDKLGHDYVWRTTTTPTCCTGGEEKYECKRCKHVSDGRKINATGKHKWKEVGIKKPTCTEKGITKYKCTTKGCTAKKEVKNIDKLGHDYRWVETVAPTCHSEGEKVSKCERCGYVAEGKTIPATKDHNLVQVEYRVETCAKDGYKKMACKNYGCTYTKKEKVLANGKHVFETVTTEPTCEEDGKKERVCQMCGFRQAGDTISKLGHVWEKADCTHAKHCTRKGCGVTVGEPLGHDMFYPDRIYTESPYCLICGYSDGSLVPIPITLDTNNVEVESAPGKYEVVYHTYYTGLPILKAKNENYLFKGWYTQKQGGSRVDANTYVEIPVSQTLFAHWETKLQGGFMEISSAWEVPYSQKIYDDMFVTFQTTINGQQVYGKENLYGLDPNVLTQQDADRINSEVSKKASEFGATIAGKCLSSYLLINRKKQTINFGGQQVDVVRRDACDVLSASKNARKALLTDFCSIFSAGLDYSYGRKHISIGTTPQNPGIGVDFEDSLLQDPLLYLAIGEAGSTDSLEMSFDGKYYEIHYRWYLIDYYDWDKNSNFNIAGLNTTDLYNLNLHGQYAKNYLNVWEYDIKFTLPTTYNKEEDMKNTYNGLKDIINNL